MWLEIYRSAYRHDIQEPDIRHAVTHAVVVDDADDETTLHLGPDRAGNLLEVVTVIRNDGSEVAIHAMRMRAGYRRLLPPARERARDE